MSKRYLLVDAYNVIHAIKELRKALDKSLESACDQLSERAMAIHDAEGMHTVLVFDGRGESLEVTHPLGLKTFERVYAPARMTADDVIEKLLTRIAKPESVTVASDDGLVRESARVSGALAISADDLFNWICTCERRLIQDAEQRRQTNEKKWRNRIDFEASPAKPEER